ncbi:hypothetical protein ACFSL4_15275 [Streptomyces caeni]|uniref:Uncharacterized protein n=1 Tax=Streptomyces caeni TaxID=2307231 RepID=A0ABW4IQA5_9ACTN
MGDRARAAVPWAAAAAVVIAVVYRQSPFEWGEPAPPGPARAVPLDGGGVTDGGECGVKGFHHFPLPADASSPAPSDEPPQPAGPRLVLGSYGYEQRANAPGRFTIQLLFAPGGKQPLKLSRTLGTDGVAVEIEGPNGLIGGAHGLPVTWTSPTRAGRDGAMRIDASGGGAAEVTLPVRALCPGYRGAHVMDGLLAPIDSSNTITGQPAYTLTVSVSDPGIGELREAVLSPIGGDLLSANNLVPLDAADGSRP